MRAFSKVSSDITDGVVARLNATQQQILTEILRTRAALRRVYSQHAELQRASKPNRSDAAATAKHQNKIDAHVDLAKRLESDINTLHTRLAETEAALDRLSGPVSIEPWVDRAGASHGKLLMHANKALRGVYWTAVALSAVLVMLGMFSWVWVAGSKRDNLAVRRIPLYVRYREVKKPVGSPSQLWDRGTFSLSRYNKYNYGRDIHDPTYGAVADEEVAELRTFMKAEKQRQIAAMALDIPILAMTQEWSTVKKRAEQQEEAFTRWETARTSEVAGEPTEERSIQHKLDYIRSWKTRFGNEGVEGMGEPIITQT